MNTNTVETTGTIDSPVDNLQRDSISMGAIDTLEMPTVADTLCGNCSKRTDWNGGLFCPACGYHPLLKRCVDVDAPRPELESGPANLWEAIPNWARVLAGGMVAIVAASIAVRLQLAGNARLLAGWAFTQVAIAEFATLVVHVLALIHASTKSDRISPFDLFIKPLALWRPTFAMLPKNAWRVCVLAWGQTAMICAVAIIGGLNYSALFDDWGVEKRSSVNLVQAIADQARENGDDADSLEDALNNIEQPVDDVAAAEVVPPVQTPTLECLIFGYRQNRAGEPTSLLLATTVEGRMKYVGMISTVGIPDEEMQTLAVRMPNLKQRNPFVKCRYKAVWLRPHLMCEVEYEDWTRGKQLVKPQFRHMLADIDLH